MASENPGKSKSSDKKKEKSSERLMRFGRNFNAFVGGAAVAGAVLAPVAAGPLLAYAALNGAQAGGFEVGRRFAKKRRLKQESKQKNQ
jgi:hypothetical protein